MSVLKKGLLELKSTIVNKVANVTLPANECLSFVEDPKGRIFARKHDSDSLGIFVNKSEIRNLSFE